ncbi:short-chain dehydrogenase [Paenibacillus ferrarius]|uniref:Short-chain dehydrogenase n=1 Tax=Paenibacillus ferrarius TaxID=1469647 RepID=A0A1V4HT25_9BACL|nr:SDR family oxidoreductase [Paenibacillus ferrarius]OPH62089.1 short-chain dehydrogenase [Paenibacillus ferrarius]
MILKNKTAVIYGGGGAIGSAVARAFAREGAVVFLAGLKLEKLNAVADEIIAAGGMAYTAQVDALDERSVEEHVNDVMIKADRIDITLNAVGFTHVQGVPFAELSLEDFEFPIAKYVRTNYVTAQAMARRMTKNHSGVILTLSTPVSLMPGPGFMGHSVACAGIEAFSRHLAGELGPTGIRVICLRSHMIPEAVAAGSHSRELFSLNAEKAGITLEQMLAGAAEGTLLKRLPTLSEVANTAAFMASDHAGAMTGTVANLTSGFILN